MLARTAPPGPADGDGGEPAHEQPQSGASAEPMNGAQGNLRQDLVIDPGSAESGPRKRFGGLQPTQENHALAVEDVAPEVVVGGVLRNPPPDERDRGENESQAESRKGGRGLAAFGHQRCWARNFSSAVRNFS